MSIHIIKQKITTPQLKQFAAEDYTTMIKGVADIEQEIMAIGGRLHAEAEAVLLDQSSRQENLWGFNIHFNKSKEEMVEYYSFINIRPNQNNFQMEIKNHELRNKIKKIVEAFIDLENG